MQLLTEHYLVGKIDGPCNRSAPKQYASSSSADLHLTEAHSLKGIEICLAVQG